MWIMVEVTTLISVLTYNLSTFYNEAIVNRSRSAWYFNKYVTKIDFELQEEDGYQEGAE